MKDFSDMFTKNNVIVSDSDIDKLPDNKLEIEDKL